MIEKTTSQAKARAEWPVPLPPLRVRKRRHSRASSYHNQKYLHRNVSVPSSSVSPPRTTSTVRPKVEIHQQTFPGQRQSSDGLNGLEYWNFKAAQVHNHNHQLFDQPHQDGRGRQDLWRDSMMYQNYSNIPPNSPHSPHDTTSSPQIGQAQTFSDHEVAISWDVPNLTGAEFNPEVEMGSLSDSDYGRLGSFESFDSMDVSNSSTVASSISENYILPGSNTGVDSPGGKIQMDDLSLSDEYFHATQTLNLSSSNAANPISPTSPVFLESCQFENDFPAMREWASIGNMTMCNEMIHWPSGSMSTATITQPQEMQDFQYGQSSTTSQIPWTAEMTAYDVNTTTGNDDFEPPLGSGYGAYGVGQDFLDSRQRDVTPQAVSPAGDDSEYEGWQNVDFSPCANSSIPSQGSPHSLGSPFELIETPHQTPSPRPHYMDHQHVFTTYPGIEKHPAKKLPRGRQRALTTKEKKEAREVREAKACWACHLSKIKCSPCSPGSPCKKCAELMGKRRFCLLPCFNDPLESLYTLMVPHYLMGHFTKANVEQFISNNATGWGSQELRIRMMWGYTQSLEVTVVSLDIKPNSEIGIHRQTIADGTHVQKASPPLGIPLAAMDNMEDEYRLLVHNIVQNDLVNYLPVPYGNLDSTFSARLLRSLGTYYCSSKDSGNECGMLRQALEIHVASTILERSLILDEGSMNTVESYFGTKYPKRSASRCVMRQVKLAFFEAQQKRIVKVLESWGSMMWSGIKSTTSDKKWATSFSVFLTLILSIDKTLNLAYYFCEGRIANKGYAASSERRKFQELVRLTQAELFERCKEIFHSSFKTRKNGKEACNPIRDGLEAFKNDDVDEAIMRFVLGLRVITREFGREIKSHRSLLSDPTGDDELYTDEGRLACIFLDDFLEH